MGKGRMEAFSDGVIAILITIMVFDLKPPAGSDFAALRSMIPSVLAYLLSFIYLGIYWNNHHHMLQLVTRISGAILWANLHLLFWLSLVPFGTAWMRMGDFAPLPVATYGVTLLGTALAWWVLQTAIIADQGLESPVRAAVGRDWKAKGSLALYLAAIATAAAAPWISVALYLVVAIIWLIPDVRFERESEANADAATAPQEG
ncbi:MAG TPA: TMEM175 family protein [Planctomycetia bacterium]|nr:TMEM175 family protein [Planctomycetia bacterium]